MLKVFRKGPDRVDLELAGKLDSDAMKRGLDELLDASEDVENGRMLYRIRDFDWPTLGALGVELSRLPRLLKLIGRFDRVAVVVDKGWLHKASELEGALIPGLDIKAFEPENEAAAEIWLSRG
ncbi:MAG: STAS/SEC14 domain-containing protein [Pseudomonadota bacterium]